MTGPSCGPGCRFRHDDDNIIVETGELTVKTQGSGHLALLDIGVDPRSPEGAASCGAPAAPESP